MNKLPYIIWFTLLCLVNPNSLFSQGGVLEILNCPAELTNLCVKDEGVRLPDNNQLYLGEENPDASSCSVHVRQKLMVNTECGLLSYEVLLYLFDTADAIVLQPLTQLAPDTNGLVELIFDTEISPDDGVNRSGIPLNKGCSLFHRIEWIVSDTCGGEDICETQMIIYDCQLPEVQDTNDYYHVQVPFSCYVSLSSSDFTGIVLDDCTSSENFIFSFDSLNHRTDSIVYQCDLAAYGVQLPWWIWIVDKGSDNDCNGQIEWSERNKYRKDFKVVFTVIEDGCCEPIDSFYYGVIKTRQGYGISNVSINTVPHIFIPPTSSTGVYSFYLYNPIEFTIIPERNDNHKNGVSVLDLIKIQKHLLGREPFTSPYEYIAADVNNSWSVSAVDLIELRKLVLGIYTEFPNNKSWRFFSEETGFIDTLGTWFYSESVTTNPFLDEKNLNFTGVKIGDLNYTAQPNLTSLVVREPMKQLHFNIVDQSFSFRETIDVPVRSDADLSLLGMQFTLETDGMEVLDILPGALNISEQDYALFENKMTLAWMDADGIESSSGVTLFTLRLKAKSAGKLSHSIRIGSTITPAEIYTLDEQTFEPTFFFGTPEVDHSLAEVTCAPNPWTDHTTISFTIKESSDVHIDIYTINGTHVKSFSGKYTAGTGSIVIKQSDLGNEGVYLYRLTTSEFDITKKMILNK